MKISTIKSLFVECKETMLKGRYITNNDIKPLLKKIKDFAVVEVVGKSVLNDSIYGIKLGTGPKRILMWSQMHGNESTTTKSLFDLLNTFSINNSEINNILKSCTLYIIPILNPDGAKAYTRLNANQIDLNRDAQLLTQPESKVLRAVFNNFKPHFCYNLHGQRTIFSAGNINKPATVSFLAPAQDTECSVTLNRKKAMEVIAIMNKALQEVIPNQVGVYDDAFNINCVGDTFQSEQVPTILFEAGHYDNDYNRDVTRQFIFMSYLTSLDYISKNVVSGNNHKDYFEIPENGKCFYDVIIRNAKVENKYVDIGFLFQEKLVKNEIEFIPKIEKIENLDAYYGHKEIQANGLEVYDENRELLKVSNENVFVMMNNELLPLFSK